MLYSLTKLRRILPKNTYVFLRALYSNSQYLVPFSLKYKLFATISKSKKPYSLTSKNDHIVQIGMPGDLLIQGRSRSLLWLSSKPATLTLIEPDPGSIEVGRQIFNKCKSNETELKLIEGAATLSDEKIPFLVNEKHQATNRPASSYKEGTLKTNDQNYKEILVTGRPLADYINMYQIQQPTVLSITTNGNEFEVVSQYLDSISVQEWPRIICIAPPDKSLEENMQNLGYTSLGFDDRGITFIKDTARDNAKAR